MKVRVIITLSGTDDKFIEDMKEIKTMILSGEFQRELSYSSRADMEDSSVSPSRKVTAIFEQLD